MKLPISRRALTTSFVLAVPLASMILFQNFSRVTYSAELENIRAWNPMAFQSLTVLEEQMAQVRRSPVCPAIRLDAEVDNLEAQVRTLTSAPAATPVAMRPQAYYSLLKAAEVRINEINSVRNQTRLLNVMVVDISTTAAQPSQWAPLNPVRIKLTGEGEVSLLIIDNTPYPRPLRVILEPATSSTSTRIPMVNETIIQTRTIAPSLEGPFARIINIPPLAYNPVVTGNGMRDVVRMAMGAAEGQIERCAGARYLGYKTGGPGAIIEVAVPSTNPSFIGADMNTMCEVRFFDSGARLVSTQASANACRTYGQILGRNLLKDGESFGPGYANYELRYGGQGIPQYEPMSCVTLGPQSVVSRDLGPMPSPFLLQCLDLAQGALIDSTVAIRFGTVKIAEKGFCKWYDKDGVLKGSVAKSSESDCQMAADARPQMEPGVLVPPTFVPPARVYFGVKRIR